MNPIQKIKAHFLTECASRKCLFLVGVFITNLKREVETIKKKNLSTRIACRGSRLVPVAGLEPARCRQRWILSPLRLPIPSHRQVLRRTNRRKLLYNKAIIKSSAFCNYLNIPLISNTSVAIAVIAKAINIGIAIL